MANTPENLTRWVIDPAALKPGAEIPLFGLHGSELVDLVAYLKSLT